MGLSGSSSKTTQTVDPSAAYKPYIDSAANAAQNAYNQTAPVAQNVSATLQSQLPTLSTNIGLGSASLGAANNYNQAVLGGAFLGGSPWLQGQINATDNSVASRVGTAFSQAGRTGSGANAYALGSALANNESNLRYTDWNNQLSRMDSAAALAPTLANSGLGGYLTAASNAVDIPQSAANQFASATGTLTHPYTTSTAVQQTSPSLGAILAQIAGNTSIRFSGGGG